jgi:hypothetical protein
MDPNYSKDAFMQFLNFVGEKGLVKAESARAWRVAASKLLNDLSATEEADVRTIDLDIAARKVANRSPGALSPDSLGTYRQRVGVAIQEFVNWVNDPAAYKPRGLNGKARPKQASDRAPRQERTPTPNATASEPIAKEVHATSSGLVLPIPLRPDFLAQVVIPRDLTVEEAKRVGAILLAMAVNYKPDEM